MHCRLREYQGLQQKLVEATGWKGDWLPKRLVALWHSLSGRMHEIKGVQGLNNDAVVISAKILSGKPRHLTDAPIEYS